LNYSRRFTYHYSDGLLLILESDIGYWARSLLLHTAQSPTAIEAQGTEGRFHLSAKKTLLIVPTFPKKRNRNVITIIENFQCLFLLNKKDALTMSTENGKNSLVETQSLVEESKQPSTLNDSKGQQGVQQNAEAVNNTFNLPQNYIQTDPWIYRMIVGTLTSTVLICLIGAIGLQAKGSKQIPELLTALGTGSLGALSGLLAPSPIKK
jgi:hypothetical protein